MSGVVLSHPWLLVLALLPAFLFFMQWRAPRSVSRSILLSGYEFLPKQSRASWSASRIVALLRCLGLMALVPIIAGFDLPGPKADNLKTSALVVVLDTSSSMTADDFAPQGRLEEAKKHLQQFVASAPATELGLVVFAAAPRLVVPVTTDHQTVRAALAGVRAADYGEDGTAIGTALASAVNRLRGGSWQQRRILLITDGVNNSGAVSPRDAARLARTLDVMIDAVGMGADSTSHYSVPSAEGTSSRLEARIEIDEKTLENVTRQTGGSYTRVRSSGELLRALMSNAGRNVGTAEARRVDRSHWPVRVLAVSALSLVCLAFVLAHFIYSELPG